MPRDAWDILQMKSQKDRAGEICKILKRAYPEVKTQLHYRNPFELLVATILSAQCTDRQVNLVTETLFKKFQRPQDFVDAKIETIEALIRPTGYYRNKARNIQRCAAAIVNNHAGVVPDTIEELVKLPGVGRKTANVVLSAAFNTPGIVVDTHVARISGRLGLTENKDPVKIEFDLMKLISQKDWSEFSLHLIYFGRDICKAKKPACPVCPLTKLCPYLKKIPPS